MTKVCDVYNFIDTFAPFDSAMSFDNVGVLVNSTSTFDKALVCLDITPAAVEKAVKTGAQLIISHHPVIFRPLKNISKDDIVFKLIQNNITAICAHTNLDMGKGGVNDTLAQILGLKNVEPFTCCGESASSLLGFLDEKMSSQNFINMIKNKLNCSSVKYMDSNKDIKSVAICSGAGSDILFSSDKTADAFVTGEVKHHEFIYAYQRGITIVEAGHFETEDIIVKPLANRLSLEFKDALFIPFYSDEARIYHS